MKKNLKLHPTCLFCKSAGGIVTSMLLCSGDSGNLIKSGKKITAFTVNGSSVLPF